MRRIVLAAFLVFPALSQDAGKQQYEARCAGCHGADGNGGGHGRGIAGSQRDRDGIREVILKGIPAAGMPAFAIPAAEAEAIAAYVISLPPAAGASAAGDVERGRRVYEARGCGSCHMIRGRGGIVGPSLTTAGRDRPAAQIEQALRDPGSVRPYTAISVRLRDGRALRGIAKNESAFDLQLLSLDGRLHLLSKEEVAEVVREKSPMPKVEDGEVRDLVAYLGSLRTAGTAEGELGAGVPWSAIARPESGRGTLTTAS